MTPERKQKLVEIVARAWTRPEVSDRQMDPVLAGAIVAQLMEELPAEPVAAAIANGVGRISEELEHIREAIRELTAVEAQR